MHPLAWFGDEKVRDSTAEDLRSTVACWTRVEILLALSGPRRNLQALSKRLVKSSSLLGNHLRPLRAAGLVRRARQGLDHYHSLTEAVQVGWLPEGVRLTLRADDHTVSDWLIPYTAAVMRIMSGGLAAAGHPLKPAPRPIGRTAQAAPPTAAAHPPASAPARTPGARNAGRPPSGRG